MTARNLAFSFLCLLVTVLCWPPLSTALLLGWNDDRSVQILVAPLIFGFLIHRERQQIFKHSEWAPIVGMPLLALAFSTYFVFFRSMSSGNDGGRLSLVMLTVILAWMAAFILCYGLRSFRVASFSLSCLLLMVPVPVPLLDKLTAFLQHGSAAVSYEMLRLAGIPVFAQGMILSLHGLKVEVAPECSGIRSFLVLGLVGLVAGRVCLECGWSRLALVVSTIPIAIVKNALRISVIAWLSAYVDRAFLYGRLHHDGGLVFTPVGVAVLMGFVAALRWGEVWMAKRGQAVRTIPEPVPARIM